MMSGPSPLLLLLLLLLLRFFHPARSQVRVNPQMYGNLGLDVTLNCDANLQNIRQVTWQRIENGQQVNFLVNNTEQGLKKLTDFAVERVDFLGLNPTEGSIRIRNLQLADETVYICVFTSFPIGPTQEKITLTVIVPADPHVDPSPVPVLLKMPYETVAICVADACKPAVSISWRTEGLRYNTSEVVVQHDNKTVTTQSQLRMVPGPAINRHNVTCIVSQNTGTSAVQTERRMTIQNIHYPPVVRVESRTFDNGTVQFICVEDANPPATNFMWRRKQNFSSKAAVQLRSGRIICGENYTSGLYICKVTNQIGSAEGYLYYYTAPESCGCLHAWLWLFLILLVMSGVIIYLFYQHYQCYSLPCRRKPENTASRNTATEVDLEQESRLLDQNQGSPTHAAQPASLPYS
ncbi:nectin-1-like isoform X2 [Hyperolius riggenbachi]|uniref:nectin-1-like isoform X2 n=1 Tax=Hyperolius riggenbachi TaxID=752182 RepID=UPI0035A33545